MKVDFYVRAVLTIIAAALVYLCVVLTPLPTAQAQTAARPGDPTGPAQVVVVGWNTTDRVPVQILDSITLKTTGDVRVNGPVFTEQRPNSTTRVVLSGWEDGTTPDKPGQVRSLQRDAPAGTQPSGLPVATVR